MKKCFVFQLILAWGTSQAQVNLASNPSFENYHACPGGNSQLYQAVDWTISVNSVDYYNACANPSQVGVPTNVHGYQNAESGIAYAGFVGKARNGAGLEAREYPGTRLVSPLIVGVRYYVSFYVNVVDIPYCYANKIGVLFTNTFWGDTSLPAPLINNFAHVYSHSLITDTLLWTKISGSFIADSAYQYVMIGNFFDDLHIDTILVNGPRCVTYYYLDNVCVSDDSATCDVNSSLTANASVVNVTCTGLSDGAMSVSPSGGVSPYGYHWSNGDTIAVVDSLPPGTYMVTITDANNNMISDTVIITEPDELISNVTSITSVTCYGDSNGAAKVIATGGTPPYDFLWSNGHASNSPTGLSAGTYHLTITDSNGCTYLNSITMEEGTIVTTGTIIGPDSSFINQSATYTVNTDSQYNYFWSITNGNIISGQYTGNIEVLWDSATSGFIHLIAEKQGCSDTASRGVTLINPTGINDVVTNNIEVYPNPAGNFIIISSLEFFSEIVLCNMLGGRIYYSEADKTQAVLDVSRIPDGIYFLRIRTRNVFLIKKFSIQK